MTAQEIIARFDNERNNTEDFDTKLLWLEEIEHIVFEDVVLTHVNEIEDAEHYFDDWNAYTKLLVPMQYADVYINYLDMKVQSKLNQLQKYNKASTMYNNAYLSFQQWYNRNHKPFSKKGWFSHEVL